MGNEQRGLKVAETRVPLIRVWIPPFCLAIIILVLSSTPGSYFPKHPEVLNSAVHFTEFVLLGYFLGRALKMGYSMANAKVIFWSVFICTFFGFLDELHQFLVPERVFDLVDLAFDLLGSAAGCSILLFQKTIHPDRPTAEPCTIGSEDD